MEEHPLGSMNEFMALPLGARIYAYCILAGIVLFFVLGFSGFAGWSKIEGEDGKKHWKTNWAQGQAPWKIWLAKMGLDRVCHISISSLLTIILSSILYKFTGVWGFWISAILVFTLGSLKEVFDKNEKRHMWGDLIADISGCLFGVLVCFLVRLLYI